LTIFRMSFMKIIYLVFIIYIYIYIYIYTYTYTSVVESVYIQMNKFITFKRYI
jgi:hypothetical protein